MEILNVSPEHSKTVAPVVELIKMQVMQIEELKGALETVRTELSSMVGGLGSADVLVIKSLQGMIYDVLGMFDENSDSKAVPAAPPSVSSSSSSSSTPAPAPARCRNESRKAQKRSSVP